MTLSFWFPSGFSYLCTALFTRRGAGPVELPTYTMKDICSTDLSCTCSTIKNSRNCFQIMRYKMITYVYIDFLDHRLCHSQNSSLPFTSFSQSSQPCTIHSTPVYFPKNTLISLKKNNNKKITFISNLVIIFLSRKWRVSSCLKLLSADFENGQNRNNASLKAKFDLRDLITRSLIFTEGGFSLS